MKFVSQICKTIAVVLIFCSLISVNTVNIKAEEPAAAVPTFAPIVSYIVINTATEQLIAYNAQNIPIQVFACSTGARGNTTVGTYATSDYYDWRMMKGNCWSRYAIRFNKGELIHSVPYYKRTPDSLEYKQYNRLGTPASAGCCRLALCDAKWLYENSIPGTVVQVVHDVNLIYPLTRGIIKIDVNDVARRGWDPTDIDPRNPYLAVPQQ